MISTVVLTHNDAEILSRCLENLRWCDEIIVIDDFSTDKTVTVAKNAGAHVYQHHLADDFAAQRNFGLSKAKGPARNASQSDAGGEWVLFVDSDEVVNSSLQKEIKAKTQNNAMAKYCVGYYLKRKDYIFGRWLEHGETSRVRLLRLARKNAGQWIRPVHEVWSINGNVGELIEPLQHFPHQNVAQFLEEINRYSTLNARYLFSQKVGVSWWHVVGYPVAKFFLNYFLYLGFLDGTSGAIIAICMSFHSFLTRAKLWQLWDRA